jgi:hypothetical protein
MSRLLVHVEGQTEETFVNELLSGHLIARGYYSVSARLVGNARQRGGIRSWPSVKRDIIHHLYEDRGMIATTMVDYYGLPDAWPGRARSRSLRTIQEKASCVQDALRDDVAAEMGRRFASDCFVPFVMMHEFEGLLFSDCARFSKGIGRPELEPLLAKIRADFATPEEINDSVLTAPSKRIEALLPGYQKPLNGVLAAIEIGLAGIRSACPHFNSWLQQLEARAS